MNREIPKTIDEYVNRYPKDVQRLLLEMRSTIRKAAPQATEKISYGIPTFALNGNLVYFAAFKNHIGFFPTSSAITAFGKELSPYKCSKGGVQFPLGKPLPLALVARMVKFRLEEQLSAKSKNKPRPTKRGK